MKPITEYCGQISSIDEYLSTKKIDRHMLKDMPEYGASIDEIIDWIKMQKIKIIDDKDFVDFNGTMRTLEFGKLLIEKGPCGKEDNTWWVSVHNHPHGYRVQRVVLRAKTKESFYYSAKDKDQNKKHITAFDGAMQKIMQMLYDPEVLL
jgi:hypothetical protein